MDDLIRYLSQPVMLLQLLIAPLAVTLFAAILSDHGIPFARARWQKQLQADQTPPEGNQARHHRFVLTNSGRIRKDAKLLLHPTGKSTRLTDSFVSCAPDHAAKITIRQMEGGTCEVCLLHALRDAKIEIELSFSDRVTLTLFTLDEGLRLNVVPVARMFLNTAVRAAALAQARKRLFIMTALWLPILLLIGIALIYIAILEGWPVEQRALNRASAQQERELPK